MIPAKHITGDILKIKHLPYIDNPITTYVNKMVYIHNEIEAYDSSHIHTCYLILLNYG